MVLVAFLHRLLLALWLGGLLAFGAVFGPALFAVLTPPQAGEVVRLVVPTAEAYGLLAGAALLGLGYFYERTLPKVRTGLVLAMSALAAVSAGWVTPRMATLRAEAGGKISELSRQDVRRQEFGRLHGVSAGLLLGQVLLALGVLASPLRRKGLPEAEK